MYQIADFQNQLLLIGKKNRRYPQLAAELTAIATALNTDTVTHDLTIKLPPAAVKPDKKAHTAFTNEVLLLVNRGKGGNLSPLAMSNAITAELSKIFPPLNTTAPFVSGTATVGSTLSCTQGNWTYVPTSYAYQWLRNNANIAGATASSRVLAAPDVGTNVSCRVTATNAAGATAVNSNAVSVTALG